MKKSEIELLLAYFCNYLNVLDSEVTEQRNRIRYREVDSVDCLEMSLALERRNNFVEFSRNVRALLKLSNCKFEEVKDD